MKSRFHSILLLLIPFIILGCASSPVVPPQKRPEDPADLLKSEAIFRAQQVKNVNYNLSFDLSSSKSYSGLSKISFELTDIGKGLRIDFYQGTVQSLALDGENLKINYNGHYLWIPKEDLKTGNRLLEIGFQQKYSKDGSGLHQFIDPEDNERYLYSNLEPFDANRVFPNFDQPDIKARYQMSVKAPAHWTVITSVMESQVKKQGKLKTWIFPRSDLFSTYIWSLHAGAYKSWSDKAGDIPLRLFVRKSLAKFVKTKDWFQFTKEGFQFFNPYFAYQYPFKKYDQIIVPEFNSGAMENVGAVTFSERFVSRGQKTENQRLSLSNVILHEMAHMWFGNLVTMKWWDDLWLNESFATYLANLAQSKSGEFKIQSGQSFHRTKNWAYWEDQLVTTHPIVADIPNTLHAMANFDGITYGKGAASLKQLAYYIGPDNFKKGMQNYFKKFAYQNTTLEDFINTLNETSPLDLKKWNPLWLQTTGVNTVEAEFQCQSGRLTQLELVQSSQGVNNPLRPHALQVALIKQSKEKYVVERVHKVFLKGQRTPVSTAIGQPCPQAVYPNYNDHAYIKVKLDSKSLGLVKHGVSKFQDSFLRNMLWSSLWDMVVFAELSFEAYADIVLTGSLRNENDPFILRHLFRSVLGQRMKDMYERPISTHSIIRYHLIKNGHKSRRYRAFNKRLEKLIWKRLRRSKSGSEQQKIFFTAYVLSADSRSAQTRLQKILKRQTKIKGLKLDQDKRWRIIQRLAALGNPVAPRLIQRESRRDKSYNGKVYAISSQAMIPKWSEKQKWISKYTSTKPKESFSILRTAIGSLFPKNQPEMRTKYSEQFFPTLLKLNGHKDSYKAKTFSKLVPDECSNSTSKKLAQFIKNHSNLKPGLMKQLKKMNQEFERCRRAIEFARSKKFLTGSNSSIRVPARTY